MKDHSVSSVTIRASGKNGRGGVQALILVLREHSHAEARSSSNALGKIGPDALQAVPALLLPFGKI
jgi:hypothetical protein